MAGVKITVTHPTKRKDGAAFPIAELKHVVVRQKLKAATSWSAVGAPMTPTELTRPVSNLAGGLWQFEFVWVDTGDRVSAPLVVEVDTIAAPDVGSAVIEVVP